MYNINVDDIDNDQKNNLLENVSTIIFYWIIYKLCKQLEIVYRLI